MHTRLTCMGVLLAIALGACRAPAPAPAAAAHSSAAGAISPGAQVWRIDPETSSLRVLVYRDGPLARLGHNHVITGTVGGGEIAFDDPAGHVALSLRVVLDALTVDAVEARAAAGPAFAGPVPDEDARATRQNMLGEAVLDAARFPVLRIESVAVERPPPDAALRTRVRLAGRSSEVVFPARVDIRGDTLRVEGARVLRHEELGLSPFGVLLGALRVRDEIEVRYALLAHRDRLGLPCPPSAETPRCRQ